MANGNWKQYASVFKKPEGLVHIIFKDDTETVINASELDWKTREEEIVCYQNVSETYAKEFKQGQHRAIDEAYLLTSELLKELKAEKAQKESV